MLNKMKIRTKLITAFLIMAVIGVVIGLFGFNGMNSAKKAMNSIGKENLPTLQLVSRIQFLQTDIKANQYGLLNRRFTIEERKYRSDKVQSLMSQLDSNIKALALLPKDNEEEAIFEAFLKDLDNWKKMSEIYAQYVDERTEMMVQGVDPGNIKCTSLEDKLFKYFIKDVRDAFSLSEASVQKLVDFQSKSADEINVQASKTADKAFLFLLIVVLSGVVLALAAGFWISSNIDRIVKSIIRETDSLADSVITGKITVRADVEKINFEFRPILEGFNDTVEALVGFIDKMPTPAMIIDKDFTIQYINDLGAKVGNKTPGQLTGTKCYDHFRTSHCKTNDCACGKAIRNQAVEKAETDAHPGSLNLDIQYIGLPVRNKSNEVAGAFEIVIDQTEIKSAGRLAKKIASYQEEETKRITENLNKLASGDISIVARTAEADDDTKETKAKFDVINTALGLCVEAITLLVEDADALAKAGIDGKLDTRADSSKHQGNYKNIIEGVNQTLDAVIGPLNVAANYVEKISKGEIPPVIIDKYNGDFNTIKENLNILIKANNEIIEKAKMVAAGDLTIDLKKRSDKDELMQSLDEMVKSNANIISEFKSASDNISASSQQMSSTSQEMSQGASEQASSAEEVSSSMEEMAANIQQNTENAQQTEKIALNAAEGINKVNEASEQTLRYMQDIADKVSIIGEIARQTNILALNAAVEAARAGEHGKGFAVVAAEVRKLAERSQISAVEIDSLTKNSVRATEESGKLLAAIAPEIGKTAKLVQEIAAASMEQNSGADQVNNAIQQLNQVTQQNAAASEEMATSSEELASQAQQLLEMIAFFKLNKDESGRRSFTSAGESKPSHAKVAHVVHIDKPSLKHADNQAQKGITINMGKDSIDSNYEKF
jgi:methyl-accepting chemotaxis protein